MTTQLAIKIFETTFQNNTSFGEVITKRFENDCSRTVIIVDGIRFVVSRYLNAHAEYALIITNLNNLTIGRAKDAKTLEALVFKCLNNMVEE